ncbi:hypothetical protein [uncultured Maribacter sp.]|uniref:hypothetical protein n=1 Tax=uncultured Maribacter sp. TaxID=431308 RepID=UPI00262DBA56|nr:hypothetical protein [uncultured Maribacter sp.]
MKKAFLAITFLIGFLSFGQEIVSENDTLLLWAKLRPLDWNDFKGSSKIPKNKYRVHTAAETATGPVFIHRTDKNGNKVPYPLNYFYKSLSWSISNDSLLLIHEQLHFDIKELYIRKMRIGFEEFTHKNIYESYVYKDFSEKILEQCRQVQKDYDKQVSFNKTKQEEWRKYIDKELDALKKYEYIPE